MLLAVEKDDFCGLFCAWLIGAAACALIGRALGRMKGRNSEGLLLGFFLGPIGWILVLLLPEAGRQCPYCKGVVPEGAVKCKHCGSDLPPVARAPVARVITDAELTILPCPECGAKVHRTPYQKRKGIAVCRRCDIEWTPRS